MFFGSLVLIRSLLTELVEYSVLEYCVGNIPDVYDGASVMVSHLHPANTYLQVFLSTPAFTILDGPFFSKHHHHLWAKL